MLSNSLRQLKTVNTPIVQVYVVLPCFSFSIPPQLSRFHILGVFGRKWNCFQPTIKRNRILDGQPYTCQCTNKKILNFTYSSAIFFPVSIRYYLSASCKSDVSWCVRSRSSAWMNGNWSVYVFVWWIKFISSWRLRRNEVCVCVIKWSILWCQ